MRAAPEMVSGAAGVWGASIGAKGERRRGRKVAPTPPAPFPRWARERGEVSRFARRVLLRRESAKAP